MPVLIQRQRNIPMAETSTGSAANNWLAGLLGTGLGVGGGALGAYLSGGNPLASMAGAQVGSSLGGALMGERGPVGAQFGMTASPLAGMAAHRFSGYKWPGGESKPAGYYWPGGTNQPEPETEMEKLIRQLREQREREIAARETGNLYGARSIGRTYGPTHPLGESAW